MNSSELKTKSLEMLNKRGKRELYNAVVINSLLAFIITLCGILRLPSVVIVIVSIALLVLQRGFTYGLTKMFVRRKNGERVETLDFIYDGLSELGRAWSISFALIPKFIVPILCMVIAMGLAVWNVVAGSASIIASSYTGGLPATEIGAGTGIIITILIIVSFVMIIPLSYKYRYADNEAIESPELTAREVLEKTAGIMEGNKLNSFSLDMSFFLKAFVYGLVAGFISGLIPLVGEIVEVFLVALVQTELMMAHVLFYEDKNPTLSLVTEEVNEF